MISQIAGIPAVRAAAALRALARIHGTWWASPVLDGLDWMPRLDDPINLAAGQQYRDAWPMFLERVAGLHRRDARHRRPHQGPARAAHPRRHGKGTARGLPRRLPRRQPHVRRPGAGRRRGRRPRLADQPTRAPPSPTWRTSSASRSPIEERRAHERDLVRGWYDELVTTARREVGRELDDYPFERAWDQYREAVLDHDRVPRDRHGRDGPGQRARSRARRDDGQPRLHRLPRPRERRVPRVELSGRG